MREIIFRARRKKMVWVTMYTEYTYEAGEMVYGSLLDLGGDDIYIVIPNDYEEDREYKEAHKEAEYIPVYRESVGQYTGLKDKNGKEIYESDVVQGSTDIFENMTGRVTYAGCGFVIDGVAKYSKIREELNNSYEVIGNVWEHPHLLEGRDEA